MVYETTPPNVASHLVKLHIKVKCTLLCMQGYFNALRMEVADSGVKILLVCPGPVRTELFSNALHSHIKIVRPSCLHSSTTELCHQSCLT